MTRNAKICLVTTTPLIVNFFLVDILDALSRKYDVTLVLNPELDVPLQKLPEKIRIIPIRLERKIALRRDMLALASLWRCFRREQFDLVHSIAPKAGLLAIVAACLARVRVRIHTFQGEPWSTRRGVWRWFLKLMDTIAANCATHITVISQSERKFLIEENVIGEEKAVVLGDGSISGVDTKKFTRDPVLRRSAREEIQAGNDEVVFLYLGRLTKDKGVLDLAMAFRKTQDRGLRTRLLLVGPDEEDIWSQMQNLGLIFPGIMGCIGYTNSPERYVAAADVICLPSYREGFGMVIIEAAAAGVPAIASRIYGITDAIEEGVTGLMHEPGNIEQLAGRMIELANNHALREQMGESARERASRYFSKERVIGALEEYYSRILLSVEH